MDRIAVLLLFVCFLGVSYGKCNFTDTCHFNVSSKGKACILLATNVQIDIKYLTKNGKHSNTTVCLPCNNGTHTPVSVSGVCINGSNTSYIPLFWEDKEENRYNMSLMFSKNTKKGNLTWTMEGVELAVEGEFKDSKEESGMFSANASTRSLVGRLDYTRSYRCKHNQKLGLTVNDVDNEQKHLNYYNATVYLTNFQVQAFEFSKNNTFGNAAQCTLDSSASKIVPIAVGGALGGLIVVVIVAYIIGRLRSRKQASYEALS